MHMRELLPEERPYEKALRQGIDRLNEVELVSILLGSGGGDCGALDLARKVIKKVSVEGHEGQRSWCQLSLATLQTIPGVGEIKALRILAALALAQRIRLAAQQLEQPLLNHPEAIATYVKPRFIEPDREEIHAIYLNTRHGFIAHEVLASGGLQACGIRPRDVFRRALLANAASLVLVHNHPSGNPSPSTEDIENTRAYIRMGQELGLMINDHIIMGHTHFMSLRRLYPSLFVWPDEILDELTEEEMNAWISPILCEMAS